MRRLVLLVTVLTVLQCGPPPDPAVAAAGQRAMEVYETALIPPAGVTCPPDEASWPAVQQVAVGRIAGAFADPARTRLIDQMVRAPTIPCVLAGGVFAFEASSSSIDGRTATLEAEVGLWSRFVVAGQPPAEPHGREECTFQLVRGGGGWLVSDYRCSGYPLGGEG